MFQFTATIDASPYLCIEEALRFRREVCGGEEKIFNYCANLAREGGERAAKILGTEVLGNGEGTCFTNVKLPLTIGDGPGSIKKTDAFSVAAWMADRFVRDYNTFIAVYVHADCFWARISGQIYLEIEDIAWGADVLKKICQRVMDGKHAVVTSSTRL